MQYMDAPHIVLIFSCDEPYYLRFLGALQICGGVGGGGWLARSFFRQHAASIYGFACKGEI